MTTDALSPLLDAPLVVASKATAINLAALRALGGPPTLTPDEKFEFAAESLELIALRLLEEAPGTDAAARACRDAFELLRAMLLQGTAASRVEEQRLRIRAVAFGVTGDRSAQTRQLLRSLPDQGAIEGPSQWREFVELRLWRTWELLVRKRTWRDLEDLHAAIEELRRDQQIHEREYLSEQENASGAWSLVAYYHLYRTVEIISEYQETGSVGNVFDPMEQAEVHLDRARSAAEQAGDADLSFTVRILEFASRQLVANSIWRLARGSGARISDFVHWLASREQDRPLLELLPPQRKALLEGGLIGSGRRSIVVSLPTSAGKTLLAEFRILQALDLYDDQNGWVAYTAPTRALVNQLTSRLRRDLSGLGIRVEKFSPALEVDSIEEELIQESSNDPFRVVVTTPEKLDLLIRGGWVAQLDRPLSLVVVDEAHGLGDAKRGLKLELLLATINREARDANFMLLTPFIPNAAEVASWLDADNYQTVDLGLEWLPNDRVIGLARRARGASRGDVDVFAEALVASGDSLFTPDEVSLANGRPLGFTYSELASPTNLAIAAASAVEHRGATVVLVQQPRHSWGPAKRLAEAAAGSATDPRLDAAQLFLAKEFGDDYPLIELLGRGVAVHHAGLSDDVRSVVEALCERGLIRHIVATTTLAQGINFPISNVVLGSYQYPYGEEMPPEDFWNIAGRAGRFDQGQPGVILLSSPTDERSQILRSYVRHAANELESTLVGLVARTLERFGHLDIARLTFIGEWSSFAQFVTHTYRVAGSDAFAAQVEQVLRGTLGFRRLREEHPDWASQLIASVRDYSASLSGQPISLVDATGFSWESVRAALARLSDSNVGDEVLRDDLLTPGARNLQDAIGVLLRVPELREQLVERLDAVESDGSFLADVVTDWVSGASIASLAQEYFVRSGDADAVASTTRCCQRLFGSILPAVSWGLSALQSLAASRSSEEVPASVHDVPSFVYYGVRSREAVALRLFGVPRGAAASLAVHFGEKAEGSSVTGLRESLRVSQRDDWTSALGEVGAAYYEVWRMTESSS